MAVAMEANTDHRMAAPGRVSSRVQMLACTTEVEAEPKLEAAAAVAIPALDILAAELHKL